MSHSEDFGHSDEEKDESHDDIEAVSEPDNDYYSFLHVPRTATQEEIIAAYKKLSRLYHPDKVCYIIKYVIYTRPKSLHLTIGMNSIL